MNSMLPFGFLPLIKDENLERTKCKFIDNVEKVLEQDIQSPEQFGCKINSCHTHAGSKIHFKDFVEAELLFHNSYYNQGFAYLTVQEILKKSDEQTDEIILIGYETYSELYLQEVKRQLEDIIHNHGKENNKQTEAINSKCLVNYCVYESVAKSVDGTRKTFTRIRNLFYCSKSPFFTVKYGVQEKHINNLLEKRSPLLVFIVPINTTLTTMDKMMSKFESELLEQYNIVEKSKKQQIDIINNKIKRLLSESLKLCLITIGPKNKNVNDYWKFETSDDAIYPVLKPNIGKFAKLRSNNDKIVSFSIISSDWQIIREQDYNDNSICECCFPDKNRGKIIEEQPIFDVTRGSVVPMLQLGKEMPGEPAKPYDNSTENLKRVTILMDHMAHRHLSKGDDHFQYFFDTIGFLNDLRVINDIGESVNSYINKLTNNNLDSTTVIYNYIIAPRHDTNAKWVDTINSAFIDSKETNRKRQFGTVRTLYFDITKEYRSNLQAKYSDFYREIRNIAGSQSYSKDTNTKIEIRFHFVDVTIVSGRSILRAADLVRSLLPMDIIEKMSDKIHISLFDSIFLIYSRSSHDSKEFYSNIFKNIGVKTKKENKTDRLYSFVDINISHMRNHEDACTLCRMRNDYYRIKEECATNRLSEICNNVIKEHDVVSIGNLSKIVFQNKNQSLNNDAIIFQADEEKQYLFLITHIINERLSYNKPLFENENKKELPVECESPNSVLTLVDILTDYYYNLASYLAESEQIDLKLNEIQKSYFDNAFIKAISRPFFIFHLRKRQAAFSFCLIRLENSFANYWGKIDVSSILKYKKNNSERKGLIQELTLVNTLVKALGDMNANYIIRSIKTSDVEHFSPFDELIKIAEIGDKIKNKTDEEICDKVFSTDNYLHFIKKMLFLSQDKAKSVLLENILLNGCEDGFFSKNQPQAENIRLNKFLYGNNKIKKLSIKGKLYLENNKVIIEALNSSQTSNDHIPYYLENCNRILQLNNFPTENFPLCYKFANEIKDIINEVDAKEKLGKLSEIICNKLKDVFQLSQIDVTLFVRDKCVSESKDIINKFFEFFCVDTNEKISYDKKREFYCDTNFSCLRNLIDFLDKEKCDVGCNVKEKRVLVRFTSNNVFDDKNDNSIYMLCNGFDFTTKSWFYIKFVMLLRNEIIKLIDEINMSMTISGLSRAMREKALAINKSITHSNSEIYMSMRFVDNIDKVNKDYAKDICDYSLAHYAQYAEKEKVKYIIEKYLQLISNEWLSSIYRKLVRELGKDDLYSSLSIQFSNLDFVSDAKYIKEDLLRFFIDSKEIDKCKTDDGKIEKDQFSYDMHFDGPKKSGNVNIKISGINNIDSFDCVASLPRIGVVNPIINIISLFAGNVASHSKQDTYQLLIEINKKGDLIFKNKYNNKTKECCYNHKYLDEHPWILEEKDQHITLWTLYHSTKIINELLYFNVDFSKKINGDKKIIMEINCDTDFFVITFKHYFLRNEETIYEKQN